MSKRRAEAAPGKQFLFSESDGRRYTYAGFDSAREPRGCWRRAASSKGDAVALLMPNGAEYIIACFK